MKNPFIEAAISNMKNKRDVNPRMVQISITKGIPLMRDRNLSRSKYEPHQGKKECARRMKLDQ